MGFAVHRQVYADDCDVDYDYYPTTEVQDRRSVIKPVPIWLCVFLVVSYIFGGAFLFNYWESWVFLDSAYFCFITLTTIGKNLQRMYLNFPTTRFKLTNFFLLLFQLINSSCSIVVSRIKNKRNYCRILLNSLLNRGTFL